MIVSVSKVSSLRAGDIATTNIPTSGDNKKLTMNALVCEISRDLAELAITAEMIRLTRMIVKYNITIQST
jgi:hypothetical protein